MSINEKHTLIELSKRIKKLRKERGLTQMQCLIDTGIHFGRIEQAKRDVSFSTLCKISDYFNISLEQMFQDFSYSK